MLTPGTRIGPFEIVGSLGAGGMGEVYRARDTRLDRAVALKILPESFASDQDRLMRFEREAKTLASLNHPHIAQIHGFEQSGPLSALVMELIDGEDLSQRIARGPIAIDDALPIARQIAEALEAAHEQGVIHRDLKPANVKVRADGTVKVLDFGLAKAMDSQVAAAHASSPHESPTITSPALTAAGLILGTAAYMSPEQAKGRPVDRRADMWAFGCVLFEMLSGTRAFPGDDVSETLASVLKSDPPWERLPSDTPPSVHLLLRQCLRRDAKQRLASAGAARLDLDDALAAPRLPPSSAPVAPTSLNWRYLLATAAIVGVAVIAAVLITRARMTTPPRASQFARLSIPLDAGVELSEGTSVAIAPDGSLVAFVGASSGLTQLYLRPLASATSTMVSDSRAANSPFFSPDSKSVAFFAGGQLKKVDVTSGVVTTIAQLPSAIAQPNAIWRRDGTIVFRTSVPAIVDGAGGPLRPLFENATTDVLMDFVDILPDDETAVTLTRAKEAASGAEIGVELLNLKTGERKSLVRPATFARYLASGHLLFVRDGVASAAHLDTTTKALVSAPVEVFSGVRQQVFTGVAALSCSQTGTCVYVGGATASARTLSIVDRNGTPRALPLPRKSYKAPRFSPDGTRLVWQVEQLNCDIEVYDLDRGAITRLTTGVDEHNPVWTPDGARVTSLTRKNTGREYRILTRPANGSGTEEQAVTLSDNLGPGSVFSWSRNGTLAFTLRGDIWIQERDREARAFFSSQDLEATPAFSPDGRWLAYVSEEAGQLNVFVRPFPGPGEKYPVSAAGGSEPVWSRDGRELFYRNGDRMMAVEVQSATTFSASRPRVLFTGNFMSDRNTPAYDVNARGEFVMLNSNEDERAATQISVLADWFEVLRRQAP